MIKYGVSNLRRLRNVEPLELRPITILVGKNSSGKSTYLRSLPLLRQSISTRTSSPILWYGDLVDFGSYDTTVTDNDRTKPIQFTFVADTLDVPEFFLRNIYDPDDTQVFSGVKYKVVIVPEGTHTRIKSILLEFENPKLKYDVTLEENGNITSLRVNDNDIQAELGTIVLAVSFGTIFPEMHAAKRPSKRSGHFYFGPRDGDRLIDIVEAFLRPHLSSRLNEQTLNMIALRALALGPAPEQLLQARKVRTGNKSLDRFTDGLLERNKAKLKSDFVNILSAAYLPELLNRATYMFKAMVANTLYIGPARARSERYYRYQDLAVSEIDPDGKNFPMFLNSLSTLQIRQLSRWIENLFGYGLTVSKRDGPGHISINLTDHGVESNIVDTGYGVSQVLPVLAQIWWAREREGKANRGSVPTILAIEQPELHLHPAHQALLADALVGEATASKNNDTNKRIHFLVESHSETFINRLGELVAKKQLKPEDVHIVLFDPDNSGERITTTRIATFKDDGTLENWPYGFFQASAS
jgi:predicted ATP-dependent endonuclease of OLD family